MNARGSHKLTWSVSGGICGFPIRGMGGSTRCSRGRAAAGYWVAKRDEPSGYQLRAFQAFGIARCAQDGKADQAEEGDD